MPDRKAPDEPSPDYRVNFFRPRPGYMRTKVLYTWVLLGGWALLTFGFQFLILLLQRTPDGESVLTETTILGFPFHVWYTGHVLIVCFIFLCFLFNVLVDRLARQHRRR